MNRKMLLWLMAFSILLCASGCKYEPSGAFYVKTDPAAGDMGLTDVISLEADEKSYTAQGDITVPMTVGLGHLPDSPKPENIGTVYVRYRIGEELRDQDAVPAWEKTVTYDDWYSEKYDSTRQFNFAVLVIPFYGEFYPRYKETVEITFPETVEKGYLEVGLYRVLEGREQPSYSLTMQIYFERVDGVLTLDPHNSGGKMV